MVISELDGLLQNCSFYIMGYNGHKVSANVDTAEKFVNGIAQGTLEVDEIALWLKEHSADLIT